MRWLIALACSISAAAAWPGEKLELSADAKTKLDANGFVVVDKPLKQGFSAYIGAEHPVFVTSDSILMAYHRVFEEYCAREYIAGMAVMTKCLPELWRQLPKQPISDTPTDREGLRRARLLTATAWRLLSGELPGMLTEQETKEVLAEVERVESGQGKQGPEWLNSTRDTPAYVNYQTLVPDAAGGVPAMDRYHRCRKWLQEMQVHPRDEEIRSMAVHLFVGLAAMAPELAQPFCGNGDGETEGGLFPRPPMRRAELRFPADDEDPFADRPPPTEADVLKARHKECLSALDRWERVSILGSLSPFGTPITQELIKTAEAGRTAEVLGGALGNPVALALLDERLRKQAKVQVKGPLGWWALNQPADPRAPALFRSEAWARKQLNTTLGSWAEYRYALQLASREDAVFLGAAPDPHPGFVEPVPKFYHALGHAAEWLASNPGRKALIQSAAAESLAIRFAQWSGVIKESAKPPAGNDGPRRANAGVRVVASNFELLNRFFPRPPHEVGLGRWHPAEPENWPALAGEIDKFLFSYRAGEAAAVARMQRETLSDQDDPVPRLWAIATTCYRLEAMAERQLAGQAWTEDDVFFLRTYGIHLARLMLYEGNSYLSPLDNAPRIVRYATEDIGVVKMHHAATARPRLLLIRYPGPEGKELLCQGSVYAYRDLQRGDTPALTQWQAESEKAAWPEWMKPIVGDYVPPPVKEGR